MKQAIPLKKPRSRQLITGLWLYGTFGISVAALITLILLSLFGPDTNYLDELALQLARQHNFGYKQELLWKASLAWRELFLGPDHPDVAHGLEDLATYYELTNRLDQAEPLLVRAVSIQESCYAGNHIIKFLKPTFKLDFLDYMNHLTELYLQQRRYHEAAAMLKRECAVMQSTGRTPVEDLNRYKQQFILVARHVSPQELPPRSARFATHIWNARIAKAEFAAARSRDNTPEYRHRKAVTILQVVFELIASFNQEERKYPEAEQYLNKAIAVAKSRGPQYKGGDAYLLELATLKEVQGSFTQAENCYKTVLSAEDTATGSNSLNLTIALRNYADLQRKLGKPKDAQTLDAHAEQLMAAKDP